MRQSIHSLPAASGLLLAMFALSGCSTPMQRTATADQPQHSVESNTAMPAESDRDPARLEQDRQAILAMTGEYHVTFQFEETVAMRSGYELPEPYVSHAREFVAVIDDRGDFISLQHVLVIDNDGDPYVVKHWRQDWQYEDRKLLEFQGFLTWAPRTVDADAVAGTWSQAVYQVDDSPRYEGYGTWEHEANHSVWTSNETWRPLPRREYTVRDDYDVMVAVNRHVITPAGWVHEQDNYKLDLSRDPEHAVISRETGHNVYDRIDDYDFSIGYEYWVKTQNYWASVRDYWRDREQVGVPFVLNKAVDDKAMYEHMFALAEEVHDGARQQGPTLVTQIQSTLDEFVTVTTVAKRNAVLDRKETTVAGY